MLANPSPSVTERARFIRPRGLAGVEALHATFVKHRYAPHMHDAWTVAHVIAGAAGFELEGRWYTARAGSVFLIPPGAVHTGRSATAAGYTYRVLYLDPRLLTEHRGDESWCDIRRAPVVVRAADLIRALTPMHAHLVLRGLALEQGEALSRVTRALGGLLASVHTADCRRRSPHPAIQAARSYIHAHWREDFSLGELADAVGLSSSHLVRTFHEQIGMPPSAYRRALRVEAAQRLLRAGTAPAGAAVECGFYDQAHLNRHFKRVAGVTPGQFMAAVC